MSLSRDHVVDMCFLTPAQEGVLFHSLAETKALYCRQMSFVLEGQVSPELIRSCLIHLQKCYDILRTVFVYRRVKRPLQVVLDESPPTLLYEDLCSLPAARQRERIAEICREQSQGFKLQKEFANRFILLKTQDACFQVLWFFHYMLLDSWSMGVLLRSFSETCRYLASGHAAPTFHASPFSAYMKLAAKRDYDAAAAFWLNYLNAYETPMSLPHLWTHNDDYAFEERCFVWPSGLVEGLRSLAHGRGVALSTVLKALWGLLLCRYCNTLETVFGAVIANRPSELSSNSGTVGFFLNIIPVRVTPQPGGSLHQLLSSTQQRAFSCERHDFFPLAEVIKQTPLGRSLIGHTLTVNNHPLSDALSHLPHHPGQPRLSEVRTRQHTHYNLAVEVEIGRQLVVKLSFNRHFFSPDLIAGLGRHFQQLARASLSNPDGDVCRLPLMNEEERYQVLHDFNSVGQSRSLSDVSILFSQAVSASPNATALIFDGKRLSYSHLHQQAVRLAAVLCEKGLGTSDVVALALETPAYQVPAILACLQAGVVFLPLDLTLPLSQLVYILKDSGCQLLVSSQGCQLPFEGRRVNWEDLPAGVGSYASGGDPQDSAYLNYVPDASGKPKGVIVLRASLGSTIAWRQLEYGLNDKDIALQLFGFSSDGFLTSALTPLVCGSALVLPEHNDDPLEIKRLISSYCVTHFIIEPSHLDTLLDHLDNKDMAHLRMITLAGDHVNRALLRRIRLKHASLEIASEHGAVENSVVSTYVRDLNDHLPISIGKPVAGTRAHVLGRWGNLQPPWAVGELCLAGIGLAQGYHRRDDLTYENFISIPRLDESRAFCSGELVWRLPDGGLVFHGRTDRQVTIGGYRLEISEVERHLLNHPGVQEVTVQAHRDEPGYARLHAWYVGKVKPDILRGHLNENLPAYMIPQTIKMLNQLPLTSYGKVDAAALPAGLPASSLPQKLKSHTRPKAVLIQVWQEILGLTEFAVTDNFFHLGGDSIKVLRVVSRLEKFNLSLDMNALFQHQTIAALVPYLHPADRSIAQGSVTGNMPLTPQQHHFFNQKHEPRFCNRAIMLFHKKGLQQSALARALELCLIQHDALRLHFSRGADGVSAHHGSETSAFHLEGHDLRTSRDPGAIVHGLSERIQRQMNAETGPLVRVGHFRSPEGDHLLLAIHQQAMDSLSMRIFLEDFCAIYGQLEDGKKGVVRAKTDSFKSWSLGLQNLARNGVFSRWKNWWCELQGVAITPLPRDHSVQDNCFADNQQVILKLEEDTTTILLSKACLVFDASIEHLLLIAFALALHRWTGQHRILIDLEAQGREVLAKGYDYSRTVGTFTSVFPFVLDLAPHSNLKDHIQALKEALSQVPNEGISYAVLKHLGDLNIRPFQPELFFSYEQLFNPSEVNSVFQLSNFETGLCRSLDGDRVYRLSLNACLSHPSLTLSISYNAREYTADTMAKLAHDLRRNLDEIIAYTARHGAAS